jgi:hypothetical protein
MEWNLGQIDKRHKALDRQKERPETRVKYKFRCAIAK